MKDIFEILKDSGIEVEEAKQADIRKAVSENYKTVNEHNKKVDRLTEQVNTANDTITDLKTKLEDASKIDVEALQQKIKDFENAENIRKQNEAAQKENEALKLRFSPLKGQNEYLNEGTENWMFNEFKNALALEENKSKSDSEIYDAITKNKNIYLNPNKVEIPPVGESAKSGDDDKRVREIMGLKN